MGKWVGKKGVFLVKMGVLWVKWVGKSVFLG
jgi:hypothetical protein